MFCGETISCYEDPAEVSSKYLRVFQQMLVINSLNVLLNVLYSSILKPI